MVVHWLDLSSDPIGSAAFSCRESGFCWFEEAKSTYLHGSVCPIPDFVIMPRVFYSVRPRTPLPTLPSLPNPNLNTPHLCAHLTSPKWELGAQGREATPPSSFLLLNT